MTVIASATAKQPQAIDVVAAIVMTYELIEIVNQVFLGTMVLVVRLRGMKHQVVKLLAIQHLFGAYSTCDK